MFEEAFIEEMDGIYILLINIVQIDSAGGIQSNEHSNRCIFEVAVTCCRHKDATWKKRDERVLSFRSATPENRFVYAFLVKGTIYLDAITVGKRTFPQEFRDNISDIVACFVLETIFLIQDHFTSFNHTYIKLGRYIVRIGHLFVVSYRNIKIRKFQGQLLALRQSFSKNDEYFISKKSIFPPSSYLLVTFKSRLSDA